MGRPCTSVARWPRRTTSHRLALARGHPRSLIRVEARTPIASLGARTRDRCDCRRVRTHRSTPSYRSAFALEALQREHARKVSRSTSSHLLAFARFLCALRFFASLGTRTMRPTRFTHHSALAPQPVATSHHVGARTTARRFHELASLGTRTQVTERADSHRSAHACAPSQRSLGTRMWSMAVSGILTTMALNWKSPPVLLLGLTLAGVAGFTLVHVLSRRTKRNEPASLGVRP